MKAILNKLILLGVVVLLLLVGLVLVRTLTQPSLQITAPAPAARTSGSPDSLAMHLAEAVRIPTVSVSAAEPTDSAAFARLHALLRRLFPNVHKDLKLEHVGGSSLLYSWQGKDAVLAPAVLLGHQDLVPVEPASLSKWTHPPFSGAIAEGYIWGRGTLDDKVNILAILEATEKLLASGYTPQRTHYFAFGHDEEIGGQRGAKALAALLLKRGIRAEYILDEGLTITDGLVPGMQRPVALIGTAEKGYITLKLTARLAGGHSSMPGPENAITVLAAAVQRVQAHPFPAKLSPPVRGLARYLGPEMPFMPRLAFANLWLMEGAVIGQYEQSNSGNAAVRTTIAPTVFQSGIKDNLVPTEAQATINFRILPGETAQSVTAHVRAAINDERVEITMAEQFGEDPSPVSPDTSAAFRHLQHTLAAVYPEVAVAPMLVLGATDARHYTALSSNVYRFTPLWLREPDLGRIHGIDERISVKDYARMVQFYAELLRQ